MNTEWRVTAPHVREMPRRSDPKADGWDAAETPATSECTEVEAPAASETRDRQRLTDDAHPRHSDQTHKTHNWVAGAGVTIGVIAGVMELWPVAGDALQAANVNIPGRDYSAAEMDKRDEEQAEAFLAEHQAEQVKDQEIVAAAEIVEDRD